MADKPETTLDDWRALASKELKGAEPETLTWQTPEGVAVKPLYTAADLEGIEHLGGMPGFAPYVRGPRATMYANRPWTIRQYAGFSTAEESNKFYRQALAGGQTGLSVAFDLATHRGYDSDHPRVVGDVGKAGVAIDSVEDMKVLFDGIPLEKISVSMTMNGAVLPVLASFIVAGEEQGVARADLSGTIQNDILKEFMVRNTYIYPPEPSMRIVADIIDYTAREMPRFNSISISGYHMQEAGATCVQELAFTLADGWEYVRAALARGLDIDKFAPRLSFFFCLGMNFFMEIAKLRAARLLWAKIVGAVRAQGPALVGAAHPLPDLRRLADRAGPLQQRHAHHDRGAGRRARRHPEPAHQRLRRGAGPADAVLGADRAEYAAGHRRGNGRHPRDRPAGRVLLRRGADRLRRRGRLGPDRGGRGTRRHDQGGRRRHAQAAHRGGRRPPPGQDRPGRGGHRRRQQVPAREPRAGRHPRHRQHRGAARPGRPAGKDPGVTGRGRLHCRARGHHARRPNPTATCSPPASRRRGPARRSARCPTRWKTVFGRHRAETRSISGVYAKAWEGDAMFEAIRAQVDAFAAEEGRRPRILVAKLGQDGHDRGMKVIATAFADIGFDVDIGPMFATPEECARQAVENDVHVVGVSTQAAGHKTLVPALIEQLRAQGAGDVVVICGGVIPPQDYDMLKRAGVHAIYGPGTNIPEAAGEVLGLIRGLKRAAE